MKIAAATIGGLAVFLACGTLAISAPSHSLRPQARALDRPAQDFEAEMAAASAAWAVNRSSAAKMPLAVQTPDAAVIDAAVRQVLPLADGPSPLRPVARPDAVVEQVLFGRAKKRKGSVCGDLDLQGEVVGDYGKSGGGCFIKDAVRVKTISDVRLSQPSLMTCDTADALKAWIDKGLQPAFKKQGPVVELKVAAHYSCRTRNNKKGAKLSEHAKGRAIDISGFVMRDGDQVTVLKDWGRGRDGKSLKKAHQSACGPFGTVLGPKSDRHHRDHFHFDTAQYRSGAYCR